MQAAGQWNNNILRVLVNELGFKKSIEEPCLFYRNDGNGEIMVYIYVDDIAMIGEERAITINHLQMIKYFNITMKDMVDCVACHYIETPDGIKLHQPVLINKLESIFGEKV